ncbi:MAG: ATP citrate lyase citrate-binding domain-containing protein [bacterium]
MARVKLSEYAAKSILQKEGLLTDWKGMRVSAQTSAEAITAHFGPDPKLVVKVDQGIKQRGKRGLLKVGVTPAELVAFVHATPAYSSFLAEALIPHDAKNEHYLSLERVRGGFQLLYSPHGGIEVEERWGEMTKLTLKFPIYNSQSANNANSRISNSQLSALLSQQSSLLSQLTEVMNQYDWAFLEINPLVIQPDGTIHILDGAVLVDDVSTICRTDSLTHDGLIIPQARHPAEAVVAKLQANTPASLKLTMLNPDGSLWMLLSGGGASIVLADEAADMGYGAELANYGEYSGNPSREDVAAYTKTVVEAMLQSKAPRKALIIAGGVANFTDIYQTLLGVIDGLRPETQKLNDTHIKVLIRRGGPYQKKGLAHIEKFLGNSGILHEIHDHTYPLTDIVRDAISHLSL